MPRLLATSQYSEGPATGHLDTAYSWFPCIYKQMLRWFSRFQVATTCSSCSPPVLNLVVTNFMFCKKVKFSRYRLGGAQRVGRVIAILFHDRGTRRGLVVSSTPRSHFTPRKDPVPILQEAGWTPGPVWTGGKSRPHRDSIPDRSAHSQSLYRLIYPAHISCFVYM